MFCAEVDILSRFNHSLVLMFILPQCIFFFLLIEAETEKLNVMYVVCRDLFILINKHSGSWNYLALEFVMNIQSSFELENNFVICLARKNS